MDAIATIDERCLGVLVSSEMVLYPGHCGGDVSEVGTVLGPVTPSACWVHQDGRLGNGTDFAACRLSTPVNVPTAQVGTFEAGNRVLLVDRTPNDSRGLVEGTVLEHHGKELLVGLPAGVFCRGSSGAPLFAKQDNQVFLVGLGSSRGRDASCDSAGSAWFVRASDHLAWSQQSGPGR